MPDVSGKKTLDLTGEKQQSDLFRAMSNPVRIALLKFLHEGPSCVSLACIRLGVAQPNLSKHLQILKQAGLVDCQGKGAKHCYFICRPGLVGPLLALLDQAHGYEACSKPEQVWDGDEKPRKSL